MDEGGKLLDEIISFEEIQHYRQIYEKSQQTNQLTNNDKFSYAYCLVRSRKKSNIHLGLRLLKELYDSTNKDSDKRDYLFYLAVDIIDFEGNARLNEYETAMKFLDAILFIQPGNDQAKHLKDEITRRLTREEHTGTGALLVGSLKAVARAILKK